MNTTVESPFMTLEQVAAAEPGTVFTTFGGRGRTIMKVTVPDVILHVLRAMSYKAEVDFVAVDLERHALRLFNSEDDFLPRFVRAEVE